MSLAASTRLDSYEIVSPLGAGGMGEVYRARDSKLKRDVAIKVLPDFWSRDPERLDRFELEAQAAAALNHPNIVSIFHVGQYNGSPYIVTELLHGESLREHLRHGPMRVREAIDAGIEIAQGLAAAHDAGIIHRDLKPENIFMTKDGRTKILDFGLAKLDPSKTSSIDGPTASYQPQTDPRHVLGTAGYMSPEQVRGQVADARSDIFATGAVLYEMVTGKRAFHKATSADTMSAILNEDPQPISQVAPSVPPGLQRIVHRCLTKNPEQRIQHATDLAFALEALSDSTGVSLPARPEGTVSPTKWVWIAASAAVLGITIGIVSWWTRPPAVPVVQAVIQLTDDAVPKMPEMNLASDGTRIYFNEGGEGSWKIAQVAASGGPTALLPIKMSNSELEALSADGASLLALEMSSQLSPYTLWKIPLPVGEPRRMSGLDAQAAAYFPDGRILFARGADLYIAENDGSSPRKLFGLDKNFIRIDQPTISPDGTRIAFLARTAPIVFTATIMQIEANGSSLRTITDGTLHGDVCCPNWSKNGHYLVYAVQSRGTWDLWAQPVSGNFLHRSPRPIQLTHGPLSYAQTVTSRDGTQLFAVGTKHRGELVGYDAQSKQFVPVLSGISALDVTFSANGRWAAYVSYPDGTLWRSRADGTERLQLTYPPMLVIFPFISPDGKWVAFGTRQAEAYVVNIDGSGLQKIAAAYTLAPNWSPDGNRIIMTHVDNNEPEEQVFDFRTGQLSIVPTSQGFVGGQWVGPDEFVAASRSTRVLQIFNVNTSTYSRLVPEAINWAHSLDYKYVYYTTGGAEPNAMRVRIADRKIEFITSLKDLRRSISPVGGTQISVAPDGSPVFTRDLSTEEIYALTVKWP